MYCECPAIAAHLPFLLPGTTGQRTTLATMPVRFHAGLRKAHANLKLLESMLRRYDGKAIRWEPLVVTKLALASLSRQDIVTETHI